ncbi:MAG: YiiX/YebB-like N1pC/P60 family cysteine hydrolase [Flavobacterium haoranii]
MNRKFITAALLFANVILAQKIELKTGDLIFQSMNCGELCEAINQVTEGYKGIDFNHMGMVVIENDSVFVLEASGNSVKLIPYQTFTSYTDLPMYVGRVKKRFKKLIPEAVSFGKNQLGVPYDNEYIYNNGKYYCSELIYDCFKEANKEPFFVLYPMTFKAPNSKEFFNVWEEYYNNLNMKIPEGELGCNPGGISTSKKIKILGTL